MPGRIQARKEYFIQCVAFLNQQHNLSFMKIIASIAAITVIWSYVSFAQERISPANRVAKNPSRDGRGIDAERLHLNENGSPSRLSDSLLVKKKPVEEGALSEIRKAERVSDADKAQEENAASPSSIPLPNTMKD